MEGLLLAALAVLLVGGGLCALSGNKGELSNRLGPLVSVLGAIPAFVAGCYVLATGQAAQPIHLAWSVPFGSFTIALDSLSAFFVLPICLICGLAAIYGGAYMKHYLGRKNLGASWAFYNLLFASMLLVVTARNGVLFLVAWEVMSLSSFFLVMFDHEQEAVREAGWTYLVATHLGTAFLLAMFVLLSWGKGTMDFDQFAVPAGASAGVLLLLAVIGFGTKAGFLPLHVWLPEAHPAAPSHVSAVMSGVMIKAGIYGLVRTLTFLGPPAVWWGWMLIGVGVASGILGVLFALAQHDLKRLLAYHSVENIGIICLGLGLWLLGEASGRPVLAALGLLGGLLHVWNHAVFKSLLFLGAGAVAQATGTRDVEQLGGLLKRMPQTGATFVIGSAAICGLPPLNGFVSELLVYLAALWAVADSVVSRGMALGGLAVLVSLGMIGALAAACFAKAFGVVFLGEGRSDCTAAAKEAPKSMQAPMMILAGACVLIGLLGPLAVQAASTAAGILLSSGAAADSSLTKVLGVSSAVLWRVSAAGVILSGLIAAFWMLRQRLLAGRTVGAAGTWDCGYARPNARMQYTASSFAWPIMGLFGWILRPKVHRRLPEELLPKKASFESHTDDVFRRYGYGPLFEGAAWLAGKLRRLQQGRNQLYVLYIALTLLVLMLWKLM